MVEMDDPLSVYDFTDDLSSEIDPPGDSKLPKSSAVNDNDHGPAAGVGPTESSPPKSAVIDHPMSNARTESGEMSSGRRTTRSQTAHNRALVSEGNTVNTFPIENCSVRKPVKRKRVNHATTTGKYKRKSLQLYHVSTLKKRRKLDGGLVRLSFNSSNLKTWDFYIPPNKHFHTRVASHTNCEIIKLLQSKLNERQLQMFRGTQFGYFLDLPDVLVQNQLIHSLLLREVVAEREDELWFKVNGTKLRFGLAEFGIITGLKCCGDADKGYESSGTNRLMDMYFPGIEKVPKQSLIDCFLEKRWKSDEDAVKIAVLYFIHTFLFSTAAKRKSMMKADFDIVESGDYEKFPWGIPVFKAMMETMNNRLWAGLKMYRLGGLPLAFQCWFYECCTNVNGKWAHRVDNKVPRILNWKVTKQPTLNEFSGWIFRMGGDKLKLKNVSPTEFEQFHWDLPESSGIPNDKEVASENLPEVHPSDDDFTTPPPKKSKNQPKTKPDSPANNLEMDVELKRLCGEQSELKSDIRKLNEDVSKAIGSLEEQMMASFAHVFKAIESLSKKQSEKDVSEMDRRDGYHGRHGDGDSGGFNANDDHGSEGLDHGKYSIGDKEDSKKGNDGGMGGLTNGEGKSIFPAVHLMRCKMTGLPAEWQDASKARSTPHTDVRLL